MKRAWVFVLPVACWCCLALSVAFFTDDPIYLAWGIFLPPTLLLLNMLRPRRGIRYAYWNRYLAVFGILVFGLLSGPFLVGYLSAWVKILEDIFLIFFPAWLIVFPIAWVLWFRFYFLPSWGPGHLRRRYPEMVESTRWFKQEYQFEAWFMPLIVVQGQPYLLAGYGFTNMPPFSSIATLDAKGRFVTSETLAETILRCYNLALDVLYVNNSLQRAFEIDKLQKTQRQLQRDFPCLRQNDAYFLEAGGEVYDHWKNIADFEQNLDTILSTRIARMTWQAQWFYDHGLNRLTEISDEQLYEVETQLAKFDAILVDSTRRVEMVTVSVEALLGSLEILTDPLTSMDGRRVHLQRRRRLKKLLKQLAEFCRSAVAWQKPVDDFRPQERDWNTWQQSRATAERLHNRGRIGFPGIV